MAPAPGPTPNGVAREGTVACIQDAVVPGWLDVPCVGQLRPWGHTVGPDDGALLLPRLARIWRLRSCVTPAHPPVSGIGALHPRAWAHRAGRTGQHPAGLPTGYMTWCHKMDLAYGPGVEQ